MSVLKNLQIRYQTALITPAPFAHFYTLSARPAFKKFLHTDFSITYPDREDLDEEDITGEGFTLNDDFSWSGRLSKEWLKTIEDLIGPTMLNAFDEDTLPDNEDFFEVSIETADGQTRKGTPTDRDTWTYLIQELIQAIYEAGGKERAFELTYLNRHKNEETELRLTASFAERTIKAESSQNRRTRSRSIPWSELPSLMETIYEVEYEPEEALYERPDSNGQFLNLGGDEWYDISNQPALHQLFSRLV
ncbi:hypothetical protein GCM10023189_21460 [Nibrella saemangeumensis]|uniref:Uncharacterized protein n=1 Tax=Nibrella saemangeumensis TaxID=1084526 RepID=A0ABP8MR11_9BACT